MIDLNDSNEFATGRYAAIVTLPRMKSYEVRVQGSLDTDDLTPSGGHQIMIYGYMASMLVPSALTSTLRATLCFGTDHTSDASKIIASFRTVAKDTIPCACLTNLCLVGGIDEVVRLTNMTYSVGDAITRIIIYYTEVKP